VGNQLHLLGAGLAKMPGLVWLYDLGVIIIQSVVLTFLGGVSSLEVNRSISIGFVELLITLYAIDVLWIVSQSAIGKLAKSWKRDFIPWVWSILNTVLIICILLLQTFLRDVYSTLGIVILFAINLIAFIIDVVLVDYFDAL